LINRPKKNQFTEKAAGREGRQGVSKDTSQDLLQTEESGDWGELARDSLKTSPEPLLL